MTSVVPNHRLAEASPASSLRGSVPSNSSTVLAEPNSASIDGACVVDDRDAADRGRDRDGEERHDEELLAPLAPEHAPRPADYRAARGDAAVPRPGQRRG